MCACVSQRATHGVPKRSPSVCTSVSAESLDDSLTSSTEFLCGQAVFAPLSLSMLKIASWKARFDGWATSWGGCQIAGLSHHFLFKGRLDDLVVSPDACKSSILGSYIG